MEQTQDTSGGNGTWYWIFGIGTVLVGSGFIYYKFGTPTKSTTTTDTETKTQVPTGEKTPDAPKSASTPNPNDYTNLPNAKSLFPSMPDTAHGLNLGQDVTVKAGAIVTRLDQSLADKGTTKLTADTALGKIWKHDVSATIRAKDSFSYPFYRVRYEDINQKGSAVAKVEGEVEAKAAGAYDWLKGKLGLGAEGFINADGFGKE